MLTALLLVGCLSPQVGRPEASDPGVLVVDVVARVQAPGAPAAWEASASTQAAALMRLMPGECVSMTGAVRDPLSEAVKSLRLEGAIEGTLLLGTDAWRTAGGLQTNDPAWTVADLRWSHGDTLGERRIARAVRFGPSPTVTGVAVDDAGIHLRWDPQSVEDAELAFTGPDGELRCGVGRAGVALPAWMMPPSGDVRLRSTHTHEEQASRNLKVRVRATIERLIELDTPPSEVAPSALPPAPLGPSLGPIPARRAAPRRG